MWSTRHAESGRRLHRQCRSAQASYAAYRELIESGRTTRVGRIVGQRCSLHRDNDMMLHYAAFQRDVWGET